MLKFFATNRAMHHLGRTIGKGKGARTNRHKLSKGGYYFVDMEAYMRFYLGTTDGDEMPPGAVVQNSQKSVFDDFLCNPRIGSIVVCVHGFNVELFEASSWFRILTDTMKHLQNVGDHIVTSPADLALKKDEGKKGLTAFLASKKDEGKKRLTAFIGFSWPSNGSVLSYLSDQKEAADSKAALAALLVRLKATGKSVNLICHSMGNYLACHTFAALVDQHIVPSGIIENPNVRQFIEREERAEDTENVTRDEWLIDNYLMIAPDVERRHVTKCAGGDVETDYVGPFYSGLQHLVHRKINVYSRFDSALTVSNIEKDAREAALAVGDTVNKWTFGLVDWLKRNPDQRWEQRLGQAPAPVNAAPGFTSINATELANRKIDHSDHIDSRPIVERIAKELRIGE